MKIYLDTNILRDCLKNRNTTSIRLMEIIRQKKLECVTSIYTAMEIIDAEKERYFFMKKLMNGEEINKINREKSKKDLNPADLNEIFNQINSLKESYDFVQFLTIIENSGWQMAVDVCRLSNISAPDSLHFASALGSSCEILITEDKFLKEEGNKLIETHNKNIQDKKQNIPLRILSSKEAIVEVEKIKTKGQSS